MDSLAQAAALVPFRVYEPKGLGTPVRILVSEPGSETQSRVIAFVFDTANYGRVVVTEHLPEVPPEEYDAIHQSFLEFNGRPDVFGSFEIVPIRDGAKALVTSSEDGSESTIFWLENGLEFIVKGPSISRQNVLQVVEKI